MFEVAIQSMEPHQLAETVDVWVRSRWDAVRWLEERMGYSDEQNINYFKDVIAQECQIWVATREAKVVGLLAYADNKVDQLFIDPDAQNQGVGSALLDKAIELSDGHLSLFTHQRNDSARRFYERRGFVATAFGISPEPECEPDVKYEWRSEPSAD